MDKAFLIIAAMFGITGGVFVGQILSSLDKKNSKAWVAVIEIRDVNDNLVRSKTPYVVCTSEMGTYCSVKEIK